MEASLHAPTSARPVTDRHPAVCGAPDETTAAIVGRALVAAGVHHVYGVLGSGNLRVTNAMVDEGAGFTAARHEGAAATMAAVHRHTGGALAACSVHQGPGLTNAITAIADAVKTRTPMVVVAGDSSAGATTSSFYLDQGRLVEATGAVAERVHSAATAVEDAARAVRRALQERTPVVLNVPLDVQAQPGVPAALPAPAERPLPAPDPASVARAAELLRGAQRPLVLAGRGVALSPGAETAVASLADHVGALLATSALGHGLFAGSPWNVGISGGFSDPTAAQLIASADVILAIGTGLRGWTTRHGALLADDVTIVHVDDDPHAFGVHQAADLTVVADARLAATALHEALLHGDRPAATWRSEDLAAHLRTAPWRARPYEDVSRPGRLDPRTVALRLQELLPADRTVVTDGGDNTGYPILYLDVPDPAGLVFSSAGFQSIGLGLASAVGAATARPDRLTVLIVGDGGLLMAASELETLARLRQRVLVVVLNDAAYGAEVHHFEPQGDAVDLVRFPETDLAALATGAGFTAARAERLEQLDVVRTWVDGDADGPWLLDVPIDRDVVLEWAADAFKGH